MKGLTRVLVAKIVLTLIVWCVPLLAFPASVLAWIGFPVPEPQLFLRLLGVSYTALVVGYAFGLGSLLRGSYPAGVVWVGIVSNGGAFAVLATAAWLGVWDAWGIGAQGVMFGSLVGTGAITAGLIAFGPCRSTSSEASGVTDWGAA
jgi:hypothetical protein